MVRGYSGYNTRWAVKVMERALPAASDESESESERERTIAVTVFFGANDACLPDRCCAFQHVPLHEYKHNLHSIVSFLKVHSLSLFTLLSAYLPLPKNIIHFILLNYNLYNSDFDNTCNVSEFE